MFLIFPHRGFSKTTSGKNWVTVEPAWTSTPQFPVELVLFTIDGDTVGVTEGEPVAEVLFTVDGDTVGVTEGEPVALLPEGSDGAKVKFVCCRGDAVGVSDEEFACTVGELDGDPVIF